MLAFSSIMTYADWNSKSWAVVTFETTQVMPWMECWEPIKTLDEWTAWETNVYTCEVQSGMESLMKMIAGMIKYFTYITLISAVLFIVINGIMYSMSWMDSGMKDEAKKRIVKTLGWIVVLLLSGYFLNLFFPWIYK